MPETNRDVIVTLSDGQEAYGFYSYRYGWQVYPNGCPCNRLDRNPMNAIAGAVSGWREVEPEW